MKTLARWALGLLAVALITSPLTAEAGNYRTKQKVVVVTRNSGRFLGMNSYNSMYQFNTITPRYVSPRYIGPRFVAPQIMVPQFGAYPYYIYGGGSFHHHHHHHH